ncbi:MAG TPA: ATP-binding cassette domain-containing protein [Thermoanaerobaculia bacterium]
MSYSLELREVRKSFGDFQAVKGVTLQVPPGTIYGLLGPNGAGKTTTIRMIMDIIAPDSGEVLVFGHPRTREDLRRIGYLPEERGLYRKMTVVDQLVYLGELRGMKRRESLPRIAEWLERVELSAWGKKKIEELSKGMQQKVQLVGTVLHEPDLLILDEPFAGLDPINQSLFRDLLLDYRRRGKTVVLSTHGMLLAEKLCDHICLISAGAVVLAGELRAIRRRLGGNAYRLRAKGDLDRLAEVPGIERVAAEDGLVKLLLAPDADGGRVLRELVGFLDIEEFRSEEPDLEEIFIKAVSGAAV